MGSEELDRRNGIRQLVGVLSGENNRSQQVEPDVVSRGKFPPLRKRGCSVIFEEIAAVAVLQRQIRHRPKLTRWDRLLFAALYRFQPRVLQSILIVRPETVVRCHRAGFRLFWKHKSRGKSGRPRVPEEVKALIREINIANPLWGASRVHGELLKLGIGVSQSTVANYMVRGRHPPSRGWLTFFVEPCRRHRRGGPVCRPNHRLQASVWYCYFES